MQSEGSLIQAGNCSEVAGVGVVRSFVNKIAVSLVVLAGLILIGSQSAQAHTVQICWQDVGSVTTFYAGTYHSPFEAPSPVGSIIVDNFAYPFSGWNYPATLPATAKCYTHPSYQTPATAGDPDGVANPNVVHYQTFTSAFAGGAHTINFSGVHQVVAPIGTFPQLSFGGGACADADFDGICNAVDSCPLDFNNDADGDGRCANVDNCPLTYNPAQTDANGNGQGDVCEGQVCGNNLVTGAEQCDDGNIAGGDGCSAFCTFELTNLPPTVTSANATVTVDEGQTATNAGAFADPDSGDTVTITASVGTVTQTSGSIQHVGDIGGLINPIEMAFDTAGNFYVVQDGPGIIAKFDANGSLITSWPVGGAATGIDIDSAGNVYVALRDLGLIRVYSATGTFIRELNGFSQPHGIVIDALDNIYVTNKGTSDVRKVTSLGVPIMSWGGFNFPQGIALDASGNVFVTIRNSSEVRKFTSAGVLLTSWSVAGPTAGIGIDDAGHVFVSNFNSPSVQVYNLSGTFLYSFGSVGGGTGQFNLPHGVEFDSQGSIWVADWANGRVQEWSIPNHWNWSLGTDDGPVESQTVTITATDSNGGVGTTTFGVIVNNVAPTATFANGGDVMVGSTGMVSFSGQNDPSSADTSAGLHYAYDYDNDGIFESGDGSYAGSGSADSATVPSGYFTTAGTRTVRGRIIDKDNGFTEYTTAITVTQATSTVTVTCPASVVYSGSAHTSCTASYSTSDELNGSLTITYSNNTNVGTAGASATYDGDANHQSSSNSATFEITQATSTVTVNCPGLVVYSGAAQEPCTASYSTLDGLSGSLAVTYSNNTNVGTAGASATYDGDANHAGSSNSTTFAITPAASVTVVTCSPSSLVYNTMAQTPCSVSVTGAGSLNLTPAPVYLNNVNVGTAGASYNFAGDSNHTGSAGSATFTITKAASAITVSAPAYIANGGSVTISGVLKGVANAPLGNQNVTFLIGSGAASQSCNAITNGSGLASCTITGVNQPLGPGLAVNATFAGNSNYFGSNASTTTMVFAYVVANGGAFVIGDRNSAVGQNVTYWGAQWAGLNLLTGGSAPSSFKGFANRSSTTPASAGATWTTDPGNSSIPPATVPTYMAVIVSSSITKSGSTISGNTKKIVIVRTNAGYGPDPGYTGTGTIVAVLP